MKIGFIGAGKVGCSLGKMFAESGQMISGYYSRSEKSAREAAEFTDSAAYPSAAALISDSDMIFLTVPDGMIKPVSDEFSVKADLCGKMIYHCSGALSSRTAFGDLPDDVYKGSVHPIFPVSGKFTVYKELRKAFFCLEGDEKAVQAAQILLRECGVRFQQIDPEDKTKYHAGCVFASNLICALMQQSFDLLSECGFTQEGAAEALSPLIISNVNHVLEDGTAAALTGPVERCDIGTIEKHLQVLDGDTKEMYKELSRALTGIAQKKHPDTDYTALRKLLETET